MPRSSDDAPVETRGLRHIHLLVADQNRSVAFYRRVFGMDVSFRDGSIVFLTSPNRLDDLALHQAETDDERARVGQPGGFEHFGITITDRDALDRCISLVLASGGTLIDKGEHAPGVPYAYISDPDGYVIEI
jgi:catechol 2,3-dioxygenase-like lactoylglutathione lyase family enzyme